MITLIQSIHATGGEMAITVQAELYRHRSAWQEIVVYDTPEFGRMLVIDGVVQVAESDHAVYDASLTQGVPSHGAPSVLVLGGGDGFVAQAVLDRNPAARLEIVDIDAAVVVTATQWFAQTVFSDPRVTVHVGDAQDYVEAVPSGTIDVVLVDLTDNPPCGEFDPQPWTAFYERLLAAVFRVLVPGGFVAVQAGSASAAPGRFDSARGLRLAVARTFSGVVEQAVLIPSFGEACLFLSAWKPLR